VIKENDLLKKTKLNRQKLIFGLIYAKINIFIDILVIFAP